MRSAFIERKVFSPSDVHMTLLMLCSPILASSTDFLADFPTSTRDLHQGSIEFNSRDAQILQNYAFVSSQSPDTFIPGCFASWTTAGEAERILRNSSSSYEHSSELAEPCDSSFETIGGFQAMVPNVHLTGRNPFSQTETTTDLLPIVPQGHEDPISQPAKNHKTKRGPFKSRDRREQTARTRQIGSCIRCRLLRIRVSAFGCLHTKFY